MVLYMYSMFVLLECVCEPTLSHQTVSIKPLQKCGPYMPMAVLIRVHAWHSKLLLPSGIEPKPLALHANILQFPFGAKFKLNFPPSFASRYPF